MTLRLDTSTPIIETIRQTPCKKNEQLIKLLQSDTTQTATSFSVQGSPSSRFHYLT